MKANKYSENKLQIVEKKEKVKEEFFASSWLQITAPFIECILFWSVGHYEFIAYVDFLSKLLSMCRPQPP